MAVKGTLLKLMLMLFRVLEFLAAALILGIYSYFLSVLADHKTPILNNERAVEGISGAACLYTIFGFLFTCCCGGRSLLAAVALFLDILFVGGFVAIAILTKSGATNSCSDGNFITTPVGSGIVGQSSQLQGFGSNGFGENGKGTATVVAGPTFRYACHLEKTAFAVSIIGIFFFLVTALLTFLLAKNHQKEKRYGPSPTNNYTTGSGRRGIGSRLGFGRRRGAKTTRDAEAAAGVGLTGTALEEKHHHENRTDGMVTGTTNGTSDLKDGYGNGNSNFDRAPATHYRNV